MPILKFPSTARVSSPCLMNQDLCSSHKPAANTGNECMLSTEEGIVLFNDSLNTFYLWLYGKGPFR